MWSNAFPGYIRSRILWYKLLKKTEKPFHYSWDANKIVTLTHPPTKTAMSHPPQVNEQSHRTQLSCNPHLLSSLWIGFTFSQFPGLTLRVREREREREREFAYIPCLRGDIYIYIYIYIYKGNDQLLILVVHILIQI